MVPCDDSLIEEPKPDSFSIKNFPSGEPYPPVFINPSTAARQYYFIIEKLF